MNELPSIERAIADLLAEMPGPFAEPAERAAFFRRKAAVLVRVADATDDLDMAADARTLAEQATRHAERLEAQQ
jgi:hypothetical protein